MSSAPSPVPGGRFQRAVTSRSTFHGGTVKDRPGVVGRTSVDGGQTLPGAGDMSMDGNGRQGSIINRITSRLSRRYVDVLSTGIDIVSTLLYSVRVAALAVVCVLMILLQMTGSWCVGN